MAGSVGEALNNVLILALIPSGAKALLISKQLTYGLKPVPFTD
jgi:hypothetical protein